MKEDFYGPSSSSTSKGGGDTSGFSIKGSGKKVGLTGGVTSLSSLPSGVSARLLHKFQEEETKSLECAHVLRVFCLFLGIHRGSGSVWGNGLLNARRKGETQALKKVSERRCWPDTHFQRRTFLATAAPQGGLKTNIDTRGIEKSELPFSSLDELRVGEHSCSLRSLRSPLVVVLFCACLPPLTATACSFSSLPSNNRLFSPCLPPPCDECPLRSTAKSRFSSVRYVQHTETVWV